MELSKIVEILQPFPIEYDWKYENDNWEYEVGNTAMCYMGCDISQWPQYFNNSITIKIVIDLQDGGERGNKRIVNRFSLHTNTIEQLETMLNGWTIIANNIKKLFVFGYKIRTIDTAHSVNIIMKPDIDEIIDLTVPL